MNEVYQVNPGHLTSPEENERRAKLWENQSKKIRKRKLSYTKILDFVEKKCDFPEPKGEVEQRVCNITPNLLSDFEALDSKLYKDFDFIPHIFTTDLKRNKFKPSEYYQKILDDIKYNPEYINVYWRISANNSKIRNIHKIERGKKVGKLTKEECPTKKRGRKISIEEYKRRAMGKGKTAQNARHMLKIIFQDTEIK